MDDDGLMNEWMKDGWVDRWAYGYGWGWGTAIVAPAQCLQC